jgi:hypothetical protein
MSTTAQAPVKTVEAPAQPKPMEVPYTNHLCKHLHQHKSFKVILSLTKSKCKTGIKKLMKTNP